MHWAGLAALAASWGALRLQLLATGRHRQSPSAQMCFLLYLPALSALQVMPLALFWWLYVVSGVTALRYLNVPMYRCDT
jgi:hypothetical protein